MSVKKVLLYPDPVLRQMSDIVSEDEILSIDIQQCILDMRETMYANAGAVGLAAPQIGISKQIIVFDTTANSTRTDFHVMINPKITNQSRWKYGREGCLSLPDYLGTVKRARKISVSWFDERAQEKQSDYEEFGAVVVQHEVDHLHGVLFIDRVRMIGSETSLIKRFD